MMFYPASESSYEEIKDRQNARERLLGFGITFLDDALIGVGAGDLVLLGAPSGIGKTQLCCNIAKANVEAGRRIHFIALESDEFEIERRLKYQIIAHKYFSAMPRPHIPGRLDFDRWRMGDFLPELGQLEIETMEEFEQKYRTLFLHHKGDKFGINELIESVVCASDESDMFIIDHAHYFDLDDDNENRAMKDLAKTVRRLAIDERRPIILVAHLRKRDRNNPDLVAGLDEFHGSSDLAKIATRVITIAPGGITDKGNYETYFRVPKNRLNGGSKFYIARMVFNPQKGCYEDDYRLGSANATRQDGFQDIPGDHAPQWARHLAAAKVGSGDGRAASRHWNDKD